MPEATEHIGTSVSVVMPAFNAERFIAAAMRSILAQTHRNLELIVVDDGSADDTASIAKRMADEDTRVRLIEATHGGAGHAINIGIAQAGNDWVAIMGADDVSAPTRLERQLVAAAAAPDVVCWGTYAKLTDEQGNAVGEVRHGHLTRPAFDRAMERGEIPYLLDPTLLLKREAADEIGGYDQRLNQALDLDFCARLSLLGFMLVIPEVLCSYRFVSGSLSNSRRLDGAREDRLVRINHRRRLAGKPVLEMDALLKIRGPRRWNEERRAWGHVLLVRADAAKSRRRWGQFAVFAALGLACLPERPIVKRWRMLRARSSRR
jgi:glycosyltransferase involved in cell wall biosynthesis